LSDGRARTSAFELSRVHGQGWNAARKLLAAEGDVDPRDAAACNPYRSAEKRARWTQGFVAALGSRAGVSTAPGRNFWRPPAVKKIAGGSA